MIAETMRAAYALIPASAMVTVTITDRNGNTTTGRSPGPVLASNLRGGSGVTTTEERFAVLANGLAFAPAEGMRVTRGTSEGRITQVSEAGDHLGPVQYRLTVQR